MNDSALHAVSGAAAGCVAMAITYPLVNLSTRSQVAAKHDPNTSTLQAALNVMKEDGVVGLYDGLTSSLLGIAVTNGIYYMFFEESRAMLLRTKKGKDAALSMLESIGTSFVAGSATAILSNPIWVVNTRQTVRSTVLPTANSPASPSSSQVFEKRLNLLQTIAHIFKTDGLGAFFHGLGPALILVINPILQFTLFEQLKNYITARRALRLTKGAAIPALSDLDFFLLGAVSKLFATGVTYPYLTVKSRMQAGQAEGRSYKSSFDGLKKIIARDGPSGLYRGVGPKLSQSVLTAALLFLAKEKIHAAITKVLK